MKKNIHLAASLLMLVASAPADAQDFGAVIAQSPPAAVLRALRDKLTGGSPQPVITQQDADIASHGPDVVDLSSTDQGPARPEEVLSARSKAIMAERDAYGAQKTPTICTDCAR